MSSYLKFSFSIFEKFKSIPLETHVKKEQQKTPLFSLHGSPGATVLAAPIGKLKKA